MGLDMYAYSRCTQPFEPTDFRWQETDEEFHYWRKHPDLHGWMEELYYAKGGRALEFNTVSVQLDAADLDRLELAIRGERLPETEGFFFGESDGSEVIDDLAFVQQARQRLAQGLTVYYYSWW